MWGALARSELAERELLDLALLRNARRRARAALLGRARDRGVLCWALLGQGREVALVERDLVDGRHARELGKPLVGRGAEGAIASAGFAQGGEAAGPGGVADGPVERRIEAVDRRAEELGCEALELAFGAVGVVAVRATPGVPDVAEDNADFAVATAAGAVNLRGQVSKVRVGKADRTTHSIILPDRGGQRERVQTRDRRQDGALEV